MVEDIVILMTACVNPSDNATHLKIKDSQTRLAQYKQAMEFWLKETPYKILFVENTLCNFSQEYKAFVDSGRLEYLTFEGETFNPLLGKGYGEMLILEYAFKHSTFIKETKYVAKITGRLTVDNVLGIMRGFERDCERNNDIVSCMQKMKMTYSQSQFFVACKSFYTDYLFKYNGIQDESKGFFFERLLAFCVCKFIKDNKRFVLFREPIELRGVSGGHGSTYSALPYRAYLVVYLKYLLVKTGVFNFFVSYALRRFKRRYFVH